MKVSKESIVAQIYEDWGEKPQSQICIVLLNYLTHLPKGKHYHITFGSLKVVIGNSYTNTDLLKAIQYLCGDRTRLLDTNFELLEDERAVPLSHSDIEIAQATGELIHPKTGYTVKNFEEKVSLYFVPSSLTENII